MVSLFIAACFLAIVGAVPCSKPGNANSSSLHTYTEHQILNFILSLERFQDNFYRQGLANFTQAQFAEAGFDADFYSNLTYIASQEHTHVTSLTTTLRQHNVTPVEECVYNWNVTSPSIFVTTASLLEAVSVSSYIGLLANLGKSQYLQLFLSILAVEARHSSYIRATLKLDPFPSPYETPINLDETNTLVKLFTVSCPQQDPIPLKNYPTLSSSRSNHGVIGKEVTFITYNQDIKAGSDDVPLYAAFLTLTGPVFSPTTRLPSNGGFTTIVPSTPKGFAPINGLTYVVLTTSKTILNNDDIVAGPATIEIFLE
ncbi:MAG: hypothetical protein L6R41_001827 [Letrouitia leprolyta]|nr:MAG: hypothetical protein L6R41_001827 [Letrouitia leprolyta]